MRSDLRILVDVMSGDHAPEETVRGAALAAKDFPARYFWIGDEARIRAIAGAENLNLDGITIIPCTDTISMEDDPISIMREKKDSSMGVALRMLAAGEGDALVSAGNTGALFTGSMLIVKKLRGLTRAGIAAILPMQKPVLLLDSGANVEVTEENLEQFAVMGSVYMGALFGIESPRVGLLNNGTEECKGTPGRVSAYERLAACRGINFVGNVEGCTVPFDVCDVLVTDGFAGNILIKTMEGMAKFLFGELKGAFSANAATKLSYLGVRRSLREMRRRVDATETGGAPILGVAKPVIKAHGSSNAQAFKNAIRQAIQYADSGIIEDISDAMQVYVAKKRATRNDGETDAAD